VFVTIVHSLGRGKFCDHTSPVCLHWLQLGGSNVLVKPMIYIFDEEPLRWHRLLAELGISERHVCEQLTVEGKPSFCSTRLPVSA